MQGKKIKHIVASVALSAGLLLGIVGPAHADNVGTMPSGCSITPTAPSIATAKKVLFGGSEKCKGTSSVDFRLVHNYNGLPDVRVKNVNIIGANHTYHGTTCDNGTKTTQYYSEIALRGLSKAVQRVSATKTLTHC